MSDTQDPINQRINLLIDHYEKGVKRRFSLKIGVSAGMISDLFSERKNKPGIDMVRKILVAYPQVSTSWLLLGEGEMLKPTPPDADTQKRLSYNAAELFPENLTAHEPPSPGLVRGDVVEQHGQIVPTYSAANRKTHKPAPPALPGMDLLQTVADTAAVVKELQEQLAALQERVDKG